MPTAPGLKIVYCLKRLPQLTHAEFSRHWREIHAPLVEKHRSVLRIARYVQAHSDLGTLSDQLRGSPEPYDGVAEIWYESRQALETLGGDPAARATKRFPVRLRREFGKRGKTGGGMIFRFSGRHESDSFWEWCRLPTSMAYRTPI